MKFAAHPLIVAVALGLLGPVSLEETEEPTIPAVPVNPADIADRVRDIPDTQPIDAQELARIKAEYQRVTLALFS